MELRKIKEKEFHNQREQDRLTLSNEEFIKKYPNKRFYNTTAKSRDYLEQFFASACKGKDVLDYCCGLGGTSLKVAGLGAKSVTGIDISDDSVNTARKLLADNGYGAISHFEVMDAEKMTFSDNSFDFIVCSGVLHHLDVVKAYPELARVLRPNGKIICIEALGYNPIINLYRKRTPQLRTEWEADHILTLREVNQAKQYFQTVEVNYFHLFSILAVFLASSKLFKPAMAFLNALDSIVLKIPYLQLMAWQMVFILSNPKK